MPELEQANLFATPIWTVDLPQFADRREAMVRAALEVLEASPAAEKELFHQSRAVLQDSDEPGWVEFFRLLAGYMEQIVSGTMPLQLPVANAYLRSWVLRIDDVDDFERTGSTLNVLHSHLPALLSSVFYLQVPTGLIDAPSGGTTFRDPNAANTRLWGRPEVHVAPAPLRLVIFPAHLEHCPERPVGIELDQPRIVVSTDLRVELD